MAIAFAIWAIFDSLDFRASRADGDDLLGIVHAEGHWLLDEDVHSLVGSHDGQAGVAGMGRADADRIDRRILEQLAGIGEGAHAVAPGKGAGQRQVRVADRFKSRVGVRC